jgi:hypothetical protein
MTIINSVKKVLRDSGFEMDADDIAETLSGWARYPAGITRTQVANALQSLCVNDADVVRTRQGLYQYRAASRPSMFPKINTAVSTGPTAAGDPPTSRAPENPTGPAQPPMFLLVSTNEVEASAADGEHPTAQAAVDDLSAYLIALAWQRYGRHTEVEWYTQPIALTAAATRHQCDGHDVVLIADASVVDEAASTARRLGRPIRRWIVGPQAPRPRSPEICDVFCIRTEQLPKWDIDVESVSTTSIPTPAVLSATQKSHGAHRDDVSDGFDSLFYLDDTLYRRPIQGITGRGNTHALKRQAMLIGSTYATRWLSVVNDQTREDLIAAARGPHVPGRLYRDLLNFSDRHGLPVHESTVIKDHLRRGFWDAARQRNESRTSTPNAA